MTANKRIALVTFSRERNNGRELTVAKGEYLEVMDDEKQWWKCRNKGGEVGYVPHTIVKAILYQDVIKLGSFVMSHGEREGRGITFFSSERESSRIRR